MSYTTTITKMNEFRSQILAIRAQMRELQADVQPEPVENYVFHTTDGETTLSDLFGDKNDLFIVHNMGRSCSYCTLWADGYNGLYPHLANRAAFVVTTPDAPDTQAKFAQERGWRFPMVSHQGSSFATDMGFGSEANGWQPGASVFQRQNDTIVRVSDAQWGPGDDFCALWHFLDLLPEGSSGWQPRFNYA